MKSLFFLGLPDLKKLVRITLTLQLGGDEEPRSRQMKSCRELVLLHSDLLACPALDSFADITVVTAVQFFQSGIVQAFSQRNRLQLEPPQTVFPGDLQRCVSFTLITRLAPTWNKAGLYLLSGRDFLTERGRLQAVALELNATEGQLCLSVEASAVMLPPVTLQDLGLPPLLLRRFCSDPDCVLDTSSTGGPVWCHVLPSMKKGQMVAISRRLPRDGPFRSYRDLQNHWTLLYGYRLPELPEEEVVYCSVFFRPVGEKLFTYPLSCLRLQPVQRCPQVDLQGAVGSFLSDIRTRLQSMCGFPARLTRKPCYQAVSLSTAASIQVVNGERINLSTHVSTRPVPTRLPAAPPLPPLTPLCGLQPLPSLVPLKPGTQEPLENQGFRTSLVQSPAGHGGWSSLSGYHSFPSSSNLPVFQPAPSSSSVLPPPPPPPPKLLPSFRNKNPSGQVNAALLRLQKHKEQLGGGEEGRRRVTLPSFGRKTPTASFSASLPPPLPPPRPPRVVPRFSRRPKASGGAAPRPSALPKVTFISSLSPTSNLKPAVIVAPRPKSRPKSRSEGSHSKSRDKTQENKPPTPAGIQDPSTSSGKRVGFKLKSKTSGAEVEVEDVERMARSNQLSQLSSAALLLWLRQRGILVSAKHRKEELMMKVMSHLAEA